MAKKKKEYKYPDLTDYDALPYNPYVADADTYNKLNNTHYDVSMVDHRKRMEKWKEREDARLALAKELGVDPCMFAKLTPAEDILAELKLLS